MTNVQLNDVFSKEYTTNAGDQQTVNLGLYTLIPGANGVNTQYNSNLIGENIIMENSNNYPSTTTGVVGSQVQIKNDNSNRQIISSATGYDILSPSNAGGTSFINNNYGLYINPQTGTNITNAYDIYESGLGDKNYMSTIGIGSTSPISLLSVASTTETGTTPLATFATTSIVAQILANGRIVSPCFATTTAGNCISGGGGGGGASQTPWTSAIDGGGYALSNTSAVGVNAGGSFNYNGSSILSASTTLFNYCSLV